MSLDANLITIGSHTLTHIDLPQADNVRLERELSESRKVLENRLGRRVEHFSYPNGSYDARSINAVSQHFSSAVTTQLGCNGSGTDAFALRRLDGSFSRLQLNWNIILASRVGG